MQKYIVISIMFFITSLTTMVDAQAQSNLCDVNAEKSVWSPEGDLIIFEVAHSENNNDIYTIEPTGENPVNLNANSMSINTTPSWSPDGEQILFSSDRDGTSDIWIMDADGSNSLNLTPNMEGDQFFGRFSPDGEYISFVSTDEENIREINDIEVQVFNIGVMEADGSNLVSLTDGEPYSYLDPRWMPDSRNLIFSSPIHGSVWSANIETLEIMQLTAPFADRLAINLAVASTDGLIVYFDQMTRALWLTNPDSEASTQLTDDEAGGVLPEWSSTGEHIAFVYNFGISVINRDGQDRIDLTEGNLGEGLIDAFPTWSPDDEYITFSSNRTNREFSDIWIIRSDGSDMQNLTCD